MKLTDLHTNRHLAFSLQSVSVSYLYNILYYNRHYFLSLWSTQVQPMKHQLLIAPYHFTQSALNKLNGAMETMACGATSGEFLRYCKWHGSVAVRTGR